MNANAEEFNGGLSAPLQTTLDPSIPIENLQLNGVEEEEEKPVETQPKKTKAPASYDELFPALPGGSNPSGGQASAWGQGNRNNNSNDDMRVQPTQIMTVFYVPRDKLAVNTNFGDSSHVLCAEITKTTGARIEMSVAKDNSLSFIVSGKADAVPKAKKLILEKFQTQSSHSVRIPKEHHKLILGKKGARLQSLEVATGTKISVPNVNDSSELITIVGSREGIAKATNDIMSRSSELLKQYVESFSVPKMYHPFLTGGNNSNVNALNSEYDVRINIPPNNVHSDDITVMGEKEAIAKVKDILIKTYTDMEKTCGTISVEVAKAQHKHVVGVKGSNISEIMTLFGVSVEVPSQESELNTITLRGPPEKIGSALNAVYEKAHSQVLEEVEAPLWLHRYIIGKKGANINKITEEFPQVHIEMDDDGKIKLEGPRTEVHKVRENLVTMIDEMLVRIKQEVIPVDNKYHRYIIGKAGANINKIRADFSVIINIEDNCIKLEGAPDALAQVKADLTETIRKLENEKERDINIDRRIHGNIIGPKGEKIREIREMFNGVNINIPDSSAQSDVVSLRGNREDVDACAAYLNKLAKTWLADNHQIRVPVFKQFLGVIIGRAGANVNRLSQELGVRLDVSKTDDASTHDEVVITGKKEACEKAQARIKEIEAENANLSELDILIPAKLHNSFIGQGGKLIRSISDECGGVQIRFPKANKKSDKVTIRGPKDDVMKAKNILVNMSKEKQLASFTAEIRCRPQHHKFIIGKSGASVRRINEATGARIVFPADQDADKEVITIIGKKEQVAAAKKELEAIIAKLDSVCEDTVEIPVKHHMHFVSRRAEVIRQLSDEFGGVQISVPRGGGETVALSGPVDCVAAVKRRMLEIVEELEATVTRDVFIPQCYHRTVMGTRGSNLQDITGRWGVKIKFPERSDGPVREGVTEETATPADFVKVTGPAQKCDAVEAELKALVPLTEAFEVPFEYHSKIIGQRGAQIRQLMNEHQVNIQLPPASQESNTVRVIGKAEAVASCKEAIEHIVAGIVEADKDRAARSFSVSINVDPQFHPKLIGKKGATISKIRDKYGVNVSIPHKDDADPTLITITGYEDKCLEAREAIYSIAGDLASQVSITVDVEQAFHARLIGQRGRNIRKVMEKFKVSIAFPSGGEDCITITGSEENCREAEDHILNQVEEFRQEMEEREDTSYQAPRPMTMGSTLDGMLRQQESASDYPAEPEEQEPPQQQQQQPRGGRNKKGFVVEGAPWTQDAPNMMSAQDFPSMGAGGQGGSSLSVWGPRRS